VAAEGRLQNHGISYLVRKAECFLDVVKNLVRPREGRDAHPSRELSALYLVLCDLERLGGGADELHSGFVAGGREGGILGEVTVPGVNRVYRSLLGDGEDLLAILVAAAETEVAILKNIDANLAGYTNELPVDS